MAVRTLALVAVLLPMSAWSDGGADRSWADRPFDGSWVIQPELTSFGMRSPIFSLDKGVFQRTDCRTPPINVPADGAAHAVNAQPLFDAIAIHVLDPKRVEVVETAAEKVGWKGLYAVSANGRSMTLDFKNDRAAKPVTGRLVYAREGQPVAGAHLIAGTWRPEKLTNLSASGLTVTIGMQGKTAEEDSETTPGVNYYSSFTFSGSDGRSATGKLDSKDYPLSGYMPGATLAASRLQPSIMQFNRSQNGVLVELSRATISNDGRTMTLNQVDWVCQSKTVFVLNKETP